MGNLIPKELIEKMKIPKLYETEEQKDPIAHIKLFIDGWTWYVIEIDKSDYNTCYGLVDGFEQELGYFSLSELESISDSYGLKAELDISFKPTKLSKIKAST